MLPSIHESRNQVNLKRGRKKYHTLPKINVDKNCGLVYTPIRFRNIPTRHAHMLANKMEEVMDTQKQGHTPGPWTMRREFGTIADVVDENGGVVAIPWHGQKDKTPALVANPICEANARLIAAAPELLEALKELAALSKFDPANFGPRTDKALRTIAKAEGRA